MQVQPEAKHLGSNSECSDVGAYALVRQKSPLMAVRCSGMGNSGSDRACMSGCVLTRRREVSLQRSPSVEGLLGMHASVAYHKHVGAHYSRFARDRCGRGIPAP